MFDPRPRTQWIVVHGAWTPPSLDVGWAEIDEWHRARGWKAGGYHGIIRRSGHYEPGRPMDAIGAHVAGFNSESVGVCLIGGKPAQLEERAEKWLKVPEFARWEFNYTPEQMETLANEIRFLSDRYPDAQVIGHGHLPGVLKNCPGFDVGAWFHNLTAR